MRLTPAQLRCAEITVNGQFSSAEITNLDYAVIKLC
ncbi:MAG: hypothetical protein AEth_01841 [Candidatus Argoarchaeum ethanivorans]|uniref:Uncharacterized protein n=1 Tax=Candidatus Argoarchaeum ethanivorans TaxID=2608793 RepID=A0A8B3RZQ6_9EURY|nr:MAG: hypothetical protein AEth_01841 [Candidatus Argoarchaeum ethanivorans]